MIRENQPPKIYRSDSADHLRIYSLLDPSQGHQYSVLAPPTALDWGLLGLQKTSILRPADLGDIPEMLYSHNGQPVCRRKFEFSYSTDDLGSTILTVSETPGWASNDGSWVDGASRQQVYADARYNAWRASARERIWEALKTWVPRALVATSVCSTVPAAEAMSAGWLGANHAGPLNTWLTSGRKEPLVASLSNDTTAWLTRKIPAGTIDGVAADTKIRDMILSSLRG